MDRGYPSGRRPLARNRGPARAFAHRSARALYDWYGRNAELAACVLRDAEVHTLTQEIIQLRVGPYMRAYREVLSPGLGLEGRAMLGLMLSVHAWHTLVRDNDVALGVAIELAVGAIEHAGEPPARAAAVADASPPPH